MTLASRCRSIALAACLAGAVHAQELQFTTNFPGNVTQDGNMFNVEAIVDITITRFDIHMSADTDIVEVYYKPGLFKGSETIPTNWTLAGSATVTGNGQGIATPLPVPINLTIPAGEFYAFYVTVTNQLAPQSQFIYFNSSSLSGIWSDGNLNFYNKGKGIEYPFSSTQFSPRQWNGNIYYTVGGGPPPPSGGLTADVNMISVGAGGTQTMSLDAGAENAGLPYLILGSATGSDPGFPLDGKLLPINFDAYTTFTLVSPNTPPLVGSFGVLDGTGLGTCLFDIPPGSPANLAGFTFTHAYAVIKLEPTLLSLPFISNAVDVSLNP